MKIFLVDHSNFNWINKKTLPVILYFGAITLITSLYFMLKYLKKFRNQQETSSTLPQSSEQCNEESKVANEIMLQPEQTARESRLPKWLWNILKFRFILNNNKSNHYYPAKQEQCLNISSPQEINLEKDGEKIFKNFLTNGKCFFDLKSSFFFLF